MFHPPSGESKGHTDCSNCGSLVLVKPLLWTTVRVRNSEILLDHILTIMTIVTFLIVGPMLSSGWASWYSGVNFPILKVGKEAFEESGDMNLSKNWKRWRISDTSSWDCLTDESLQLWGGLKIWATESSWIFDADQRSPQTWFNPTGIRFMGSLKLNFRTEWIKRGGENC
jgi:hypothetical protein